MLEKRPGWQKFLRFCGLALATAFLVWLANQLYGGVLFEAIGNFSYEVGARYQEWFADRDLENPIAIVFLSFLGGLVASISPCILSLLPVNLTYIGTREIKSRSQAFFKASAFVLGVATTLSLLGIFSALAGAILIEYRGYVQIAIGVFIVIMGLSLLGVVRLPLPQTHVELPFFGNFGVGVTFALVSSPCTSPVLISILAVGGATGSQFKSILAMISFSLGYTAIIFLASLFAGLAKQTRWLLERSEAIARFGSVMLIGIGIYYLIDGATWLRALWTVPG